MKSEPAAPANRCVKYGSLVSLTLTASFLPILAHITRVRPPDERYSIPVQVTLVEWLKLSLCVVALVVEEKGISKSVTSLHRGFVEQFRETLKVGVVSAIFALQNNFYYIGLSYLDAAVFNIIYSLRILTTAIFFIFLLGKVLSRWQWLALLILTIGVALAHISQSKESVHSVGAGHEHNETLGALVVLCMCVTSGFASVYYERILKGGNPSLWLQNIRLAVFGIALNTAVTVAQAHSFIAEKGVLFGFDELVWLCAVTSAVGSILIALVMKYADNILKSYAQSIAIVINCVFGVIFMELHLDVMFAAGALMVVVSTVIYSMYPYVQPSAASKEPLTAGSSSGDTQILIEHAS